jgi:hypothetical protein
MAAGALWDHPRAEALADVAEALVRAGDAARTQQKYR